MLFEKRVQIIHHLLRNFVIIPNEGVVKAAISTICNTTIGITFAPTVTKQILQIWITCFNTYATHIVTFTNTTTTITIFYNRLTNIFGRFEPQVQVDVVRAVVEKRVFTAYAIVVYIADILLLDVVQFGQDAVMLAQVVVVIWFICHWIVDIIVVIIIIVIVVVVIIYDTSVWG